MAERLEYITRAVTQDTLGRTAPSPLIAETIVGGIYETVYRRIARGDTAELPTLLPDLVESALLPYVGEQRAFHRRVRLVPLACRRRAGSPNG